MIADIWRWLRITGVGYDGSHVSLPGVRARWEPTARGVLNVAGLLRMVVVTVGVLSLACSKDSSAEQSQENPSTSITRDPSISTPTSFTSTTDPEDPLDPDVATEDIQELISRYDAAVAAILDDPSVAGDREHPAVREYLALFAPGSDFASGALASWIEMSDRRYRPGDGGRMYESTVLEVQPEPDETAAFRICSLKSIVIVDREGKPISGEWGWSSATGVAVLVDREWRLRDLTAVAPTECDQVEGASE